MSYVTEFTEEQIKYYEERCRPDHGHIKNSKHMTYGNDFYSDTGFISDNDSLIDVAHKDDKTIMNLLGEGGHELIGKILVSIMAYDQVKEKFPEYFIEVNTDDYIVKRKSPYCGSQRCPFMDMHSLKCNMNTRLTNYAYVDYVITKKSTGEILETNSLMPHMYYDHHFYEGTVPHRQSPKKLIKFFNIK